MILQWYFDKSHNKIDAMCNTLLFPQMSWLQYKKVPKYLTLNDNVSVKNCIEGSFIGIIMRVDHSGHLTRLGWPGVANYLSVSDMI